MSIAENDEDDDLDIYSNLPNFNYDDSLQKLETRNKLLFRKLCALEKKVAALTKELFTCKREKQQLAKNISSLYKSAKQEIIRKNRQIKELTARKLLYDQQKYLSSKDSVSIKERKNELSNQTKTLHRISPTKVVNVHKSYETKFSRHKYGTRSSSKKEGKISERNSNKLKCMEDNENSNDLEILKKSNDSNCVDISNNKELNDKLPISHFIKKLPSSGNLMIEKNALVDQSTFKNVEIEHCENVCKVKKETETEETNSKIPVSSVVLPDLIGPRTTFSVRRYKQLYGVSPVKLARGSSITSKSSSLNNPSDTHDEGALPINFLCKEIHSIIPRTVNSSFGKKLDSLSKTSNENDVSNNCLELSDSRSLRKKNENSRLKHLEHNLVSEETSMILEKSKDIAVMNKPVTGEILENENTSRGAVAKKTGSNDDKILSSSTELCTKENIRDNSKENVSESNSYESNEILSCASIIDPAPDDAVNLKMIDSSKVKNLPSSSFNIIKNECSSVVGCNVNNFVQNHNKDVNTVESESVLETSHVENDEKTKSYSNENDEIKKETSLVVEKSVDCLGSIHKKTKNRMLDFENKTVNLEEIRNENVSGNVDVESRSCSLEKNISIQNKSDHFIDGDAPIEKKEILDCTDDVLLSCEKPKEKPDVVIENHSNIASLKNDGILESSSKKFVCSSPNTSDSFTLEITHSDDEGEIDVVGQSECILANTGLDRQPSSKKTENVGAFSEISRSLQDDSSSLKNCMPPEKSSLGLNVFSAEKESLNKGTTKNVSPVKDGDSQLYNKSPKKPVNLTNPTKKKYKSKEQQFKDLFGDSPFKIDDTSSSCNENIGNNYSLFNNINSILTKVQNKESNEINILLDLQQSNLSSDALRAPEIKVPEVNIEKTALITPDVLKSYLDFKEAFQQGKSEIKKSNIDKATEENDLKHASSPTKNTSVDKENPCHHSFPKISPGSPPKIKNILCDKTLKSNSNISVSSEKQSDLIRKVDKDNLKSNENEIKSDADFSPGVFGSELDKNSSETINIKIDNTIKFSENTTLTSCEDTTIHMIKHFSKIGETVSPIKTPSKHLKIIDEVKDDFSSDKTSPVVGTCADKNSEICNKTSSIELTISKNSGFTTNDDPTIKTIRNFCGINDFITPIKTSSKLSGTNNGEKQFPSDQKNTIKQVVSKDLDQSSRKSEEKNLTPTIIKKDGISVCLSSEHCEFKRKRQIRKIIKCNDGDKPVDSKPGFTKQDESNVLSSVMSKRKCEDISYKNKITSEEPDMKKRKVSTNNTSSVKLNPKRKERESRRKYDKDNLRKHVIKNSLSQKNDRMKSIEMKKVPHQDSSKLKSRKEELVDKNKIFSKKDNEERVNEKREDRSKFQRDGSTNSSINSIHSQDKKKGSILSSSICERRSPSEYFNRQHKSRLKNDDFDFRRSNHRVSRLSTPPYTVHARKHRNERRLEMELRSTVLKQIILEEDYKIKFKSQEERLRALNERQLCDSNNLKLKQASTAVSSQSPNNNVCFPIRRLSESPNLKEIPTCTNQNEENLMEWKIQPLQINKASSNLIGKFISHKMIPGYSNTGNNNEASSKQCSDLLQRKNNQVPCASAAGNGKNLCKTNPIVIRKRTARLGQRKLEDSKGFLTNISTVSKEINDNQVKLNSTDDDKNTNVTIDQDGINTKKKQPVQKTRCIVKTPLDFKKQFGDNKMSGDDQDLSVSSSSEESRHSDESWKPKRQRKCKK